MCDQSLAEVKEEAYEATRLGFIAKDLAGRKREIDTQGDGRTPQDFLLWQHCNHWEMEPVKSER